MKRESANWPLSRFALRGKTMERKRIAGRFAAEDKGGVVKKQPVAPRARNTSRQHETVLAKPSGLAPNAPSQKPERRAKGLLGLLQNWKKSSAAPVRTDDTDSTALDGSEC